MSQPPMSAFARRLLLAGDAAQARSILGISGSLESVWPIGSIFIGATGTNPATLLGFGTWQARATGRVLIGLDSGDADFDTPLETGGSKTVTLGQAQLPDYALEVNDPQHLHAL